LEIKFDKPLRAITEWARYAQILTDAKGMICCANHPLPVEFVLLPHDNFLGGDGYAIASDDTSTTVTALTPRGLLYGAYTLIDTCRQAGGHFVALNIQETPDFAMRMLWSWSRLDNTYLHSPYLELPSVLSHANLDDPESNPEVMRFIRHMASMRINALTLTYDLHLRGQQHIYRPFYTQLDKFSRFLKEWGIDLYLYTGGVPEKDFFLANGGTDCPFNPVIQNFWDELITELYEKIPELGGLHIAGSLGGAAGGRLYGFHRFPDRLEFVRARVLPGQGVRLCYEACRSG